MHMLACACLCIHMYAYACICLHMLAVDVYACICMRMHVYACACMHTACTCMHMHAYACIRMHLHLSPLMLLPSQPQQRMCWKSMLSQGFRGPGTRDHPMGRREGAGTTCNPGANIPIHTYIYIYTYIRTYIHISILYL